MVALFFCIHSSGLVSVKFPSSFLNLDRTRAGSLESRDFPDETFFKNSRTLLNTILEVLALARKGILHA